MVGTKRLFSIGGTITEFRRRLSTTNTSSQTPRRRKQAKPKKEQDCDTEAEVKTEWTDQQKRIISAVEEGKSVFISGSAGTGKTFLVKHILTLLKKRHKASCVFATGSTGVAACAINGQTLHSFSGMSCQRWTSQGEDFSGWVNAKARKRWLKLKALIVDEISMVDREMFEAVERIARVSRGNDSPWGGVQVVASGDFFQLSPIVSGRGVIEFAFEAKCWNSTFALQIELDAVFRQSEGQMIELLSKIRRGKCDRQGLKLLESRCCNPSAELDPSIISLYPRNIDSDRVNDARLKSLNKQQFVYKAVNLGREPWITDLKKGKAPDEVSLCEGARVMLVRNLNMRRKLVNGSIGTIVRFVPRGDKNVPEVAFDGGQTVVIEPEAQNLYNGGMILARRTQIPLILAWSVSVHKCQGMSIERLRTDLSNAFGVGMVYVALSRVTSLDGLHLLGFNPSKIKAHPKVIQFYDNLAREQRHRDSVSNGGPKFHFSLSEFLSSRAKNSETNLSR